MAQINGKLTKLGKNDFGGVVMQIDGSVEIIVYDNDAPAAAPWLASLNIWDTVQVPVKGYKGKIQLDMATIGQAPTTKGNKFLGSLKPFYSAKKNTTSEEGTKNTESTEDQDRG